MATGSWIHQTPVGSSAERRNPRRKCISLRRRYLILLSLLVLIPWFVFVIYYFRYTPIAPSVSANHSTAPAASQDDITPADVPSSHEADGIPSTHEADGIPSTHEADGIPSTQEADGIPSSQEGRAEVFAGEAGDVSISAKRTGGQEEKTRGSTDAHESVEPKVYAGGTATDAKDSVEPKVYAGGTATDAKDSVEPLGISVKRRGSSDSKRDRFEQLLKNRSQKQPRRYPGID
eukprot:GHVS01074575.1.p1 GENE.GHVS01074575.1~~GHVS01074575.1.p1  ORF type:complete len:233 (+),score=21.66 GHVS01074575.1:206-904(+)